MKILRIPDKAKSIMDTLEMNGYEAYIVGGFIRDCVISKRPNDVDIFTNAPGEDILKIFPQGKILGGEERQKKILTVIVDDTEVSQFRKSGDRTETGNTLQDHLSTCDFTINALACHKDGNVIDKYGGIVDARDNRVVKCVGNPEDRINEDKLRVMRALRFSLCNRLTIDHELFHVIRKTDITDLPIERIREEFMKIIGYKYAIERLCELGLLFQIFPEMEKLQVDGGRYHAETALAHSNYAYQNSIELTDNKLLMFACLMHDIGKGRAVFYNEEKQSNSFKKHDIIGYAVIKDIMESLKFSKEEIKYVSTLVRYHMVSYDKPSRKRVKNVVRKLTEAGVDVKDLILLSYCDSQANMKTQKKKYHEFVKSNKFLKVWEDIKKDEFVMTTKDLEIGGQDLMNLGMKPGPEMGQLLKDLLFKIDCGELKNRKKLLLNEVRKIVNEK